MDNGLIRTYLNVGQLNQKEKAENVNQFNIHGIYMIKSYYQFITQVEETTP